MRARESAQTLWWLIHKDLLRELRTYSSWPGMLLLGIVTVFLLAAQLNVPLETKTTLAGGLLWLAIFFAGTTALERSFSGERDAGCTATLRLFPIHPSQLFLAKLAVNVVSLLILEIVLIPAFIVLTDVPLLNRPAPFLLVTMLGTLCFASIGTLVSALTSGMRSRSGLLAFLLLPLITPVMLGCAEATRLVLTDDIGPQFWQWIRLLAVFGGVFTTAGLVLFEFVTEE